MSKFWYWRSRWFGRQHPMEQRFRQVTALAAIWSALMLTVICVLFCIQFG